MRVLLIAGGWSKEREVSLSGALEIQKALEHLGHEIIFLDLSPDYAHLVKLAGKAEVVFINLHGCPGEDGSIQALLDDVGIPYQGSGPRGSFLALNKAVSKQIFNNHSLPTPEGSLVFAGANAGEIPEPPVICKPNLGGSSLDMHIFMAEEKLNKHLLLLPGNQEFIVEKFIKGREISCAVLDDTALAPILIKPRKGNFFDYRSKYDPDGAEELCPAPIGPKLIQKVRNLALKAHRILGLRHYSRTDFMLDDTDNLFILEINTLPGMTRTSLVPMAAREAGLEFADLIAKLLALALNTKTKEVTG